MPTLPMMLCRGPLAVIACKSYTCKDVAQQAGKKRTCTRSLLMPATL